MKTLAFLVCSALVLALPPAQDQNRGLDTTFSGAGLSAEEVREILADIERSAYDTPESWSDELGAKRVDLGANPGIVLQGTKLLCGGTGNCQLFLFQRY